MGKDPAFLFYPNDYVGGTMGMTFEEKGAYMDLLMLQFNRGHMGGQVIGQVVGQIWVNIQSKFKVDVDGLYYNQRLDDEIKKRRNFVGSRKNNLSGANQYTKKTGVKGGHMEGHMGGHMTNHMENVNVNKDIDVITTKEKGSRGKPFTKPTLDEVASYCTERNNSISGQDFLDYYDTRGWMLSNGRKMADWQAAVRTWENREKQKNKPKQTEAERIMNL